MRLNKLFFILLLNVSVVIAQDIGTTEIKVLEGFTPEIPDAIRLNENAIFADTIKKDRTQSYQVIDVSLKSNYKAQLLNPAKVKDSKIPLLYSTKIQLGFGSAWTTNASIVHSSARSKNLSYGLIANHFANKYSLAKNSQNRIFLFGKQVRSSHIYLANLEYDRKTAFYGDLLGVEAKFYRNRFSYSKFSFSAISKENFHHNLSHYTNFSISDLNEFSENEIHFTSKVNYFINDLPIEFFVRYENYLNYNNDDSPFRQKRSQLFAFSPNILFKRYNIDFNLGFDFDFVSDGSRLQFFPNINMYKEIVRDIVLINGGLRHIKNRHTLKSLSDENIYMHTFGMNQANLEDQETYQYFQYLLFSDRNELYVSMKNVLSKGEVFEGEISYGKMQNFTHFIQINTPIYNRFQANYIDVLQLHCKADYSKKINDLLSFIMTLDYYRWSQEVYYKPNFIYSVSLPFTLRNKIKVSSELIYKGPRNSFSKDTWPSPYNDNDGGKLDSQLYANLSIHYIYSKKISAYLDLNNITNSVNDVWPGYERLGFNGVFGLKYFF